MKLPERIAAYSVEREIGRGGMGVVYLGRDSRLGRAVALKVLPEAVARDPERLARLEREARVLASLNHPNVAAIYGLEDAGESRCLVLEFVEGATLAERLAAGPMPVDEAIAVCAAVAAGVEAAHEAGVVHRDLKPGNIKVTPEGKVKVLDFGLAKGGAAVRSSMDVLSSPTITVAQGPVTGVGMVMGTAGYMSPEQARGKSVDRRTDIWALGCVLYECLTGKMVFGGETVSDAIAAILEREPDWSLLPAKTPVRVRELLIKCLEKDASRRLRDIGDARLELERAASGREWTTTAMAAAGGGRRGIRWSWPVAAMVVIGAGLGLGLGAAGMWAVRGREDGNAVKAVAPPAAVVRLSVAMPESPAFYNDWSGISPDGRMVAVIAYTPDPPKGDGLGRVYVRRMDSAEFKVIEGSEGAKSAAFSPDGKWVAWRARLGEGSERYAVRKASVEGGPWVALWEYAADHSFAMDWGDDGNLLVVTQENQAVVRIPGAGGAAEELFRLDAERDGADWIRHISAMPGGKSMLIAVAGATETAWHVKTGVVRFGEPALRMLLDHGEGPQFVRLGGAGCLLVSRRDGLFAARFDPEKLELTGSLMPILSGLSRPPGLDSPFWDCSDNGVLVYSPSGGAAGQRRLAFFDSDQGPPAESGFHGAFEGFRPEISPDGRWVITSIIDDDGFDQLAVFGMDGSGPRMLRMPGADSGRAIWSADGQRLIFQAKATRRNSRIMWRAADGSDEPEVLLESDKYQNLSPIAVSPDGKTLLLETDATAGASDLLQMDLAGERQLKPWLATPASEKGAVFSPDGKWVAYHADNSGRYEVYIRPAAGGGGAVQVSTAGGTRPAWPSKGDSIFWGGLAGKPYQVKVTLEPFKVGTPTPIDTDRASLYDFAGAPSVSPDGTVIVAILKGQDEAQVKDLTVVLNWFTELEAKLGVK